jgi:MRG-binding protein
MSTESQAPVGELSSWTDDQESALLQAIIRWKPVGMHKHFRMIAIREHLLNQGLINPEDAHTTTAGIWAKLATLYDLAKLDEREDAITDGLEDGSNAASYWRDFALPEDEDDFRHLMWQRRLAPEGTSSPDVSRRESTVADTDEPRSSPVSGRGSVRGGRASGRRGGRLSRLQAELETEKSSRRTSKANSIADEDQPMEDANEDEEEDNESGEEEEESSEQEEEERKTETKRGRGGRRGPGRRGRRR